MCILCVIQKWSRRVATMLPWLVIPLIGLWALSQLLPPAFRFEITSPRLACVFVLLVTLFWYEILMPQLSAWRLRRNALLRERKRFEALELQKLRKTATRKCRNCLTPYRDQNPGGGKFMCSYCGHLSKRPVLDLPIPPGLGISNSGIIKDLFGKGGKILNGKVWSDNGSFCPEWLENGNWVVNGSLPGKSTYPRKSGIGFFGGNNNDQFSTDRSYSDAYVLPRKWFIAFLKSIRWIWRKLFRISSSREDDSSDAEHRAMLAKRGDNGGSGQESRGEKARRKAEEKRQARLEKELLEEEERKQREDVARLVEERRRLRDEKLEAENRAKSSLMREKDRKEAERKRQERKIEKDKGSSKSNSDVEEIERKAGKENERKRDGDRRSESDRREPHRTGQPVETGHGAKANSANTASRGNAGARYFDRVKGSFLSSSKAFTGGSFFGKVTRNPPAVSKDIKTNTSTDYFQASASRREPDRVAGKPIMNGDEKGINRLQVMSEPHRRTPPKSWHQLFTKSPASSNVISRPNAKSQAETQSPLFPSSPTTYDNPINLPSPFFLPPFPNGPVSNSTGMPSAKESVFPLISEARHNMLPDEPELFEDPCYVPDPVSLLGPVSESLDNFQLDLGTGFIPDELEKPCPVKVRSSLDASRPSPIESPLSRLRANDEKPHNHTYFPTSPNAQDMHSFHAADFNNVNEKTWQMWDTSPLGQNGFGLVGGPPSWGLPLEQNRSAKEETMHAPSQRNMASLFAKDDPVKLGTHFPGKMFIGSYGTSVPLMNDHDPWSQKPFSPPISAAESYYPIKPVDDTQKNLVYHSSSRQSAHSSFDASQTWSKNEQAVQGAGEVVGNPSVLKPHLGGLYSTPDVQSLWSFE